MIERIEQWLIGKPSWRSLASDGVQYWRQRVFDVAIAVGLVLGAVSLVPGVTRALAEQNFVLLAADVAVFAVAVIVLLARRLGYRVRAAVLVGAVYGVGLTHALTSGLLNAGPVWLFAGTVTAAILFNPWVAAALMGLLVLVLAAQFVAAGAGLLSPELAAVVRSARGIEVAMDLVLLSAVVSLFLGILLLGLRESFFRIQRIGQDLKTERARLLETNRELEEEIARRRTAEQERTLLATAMEQATEAVIVFERDGEVEYVNHAFEELFGRTRAEVVGLSIDGIDLFSDQLDEALTALDRGHAWVGRLTGRGEGREWGAQASFSILHDESGRPDRRLAVVRDVSRETELEIQLQQARKMQAVGTLAGGIAHDFNNLLVPIMGTAELLRADVRGEAVELLDDIVRSARRGRELVAQIMAFSRGGPRREATAHLGAVVEDSERLLRSTLPADVELRVSVEEPGPIPVSEAEAQQILMNLCSNAVQSMHGRGGTLDIRVDEVQGSAVDTTGALTSAPPEQGQTYIRLTATDTGIGMSAETLTRVFEPFFTTRPEGEGAGLGMAMVHGVTRGVDGTVVVRSEEGRGTTVEVLLPRGRDPAAETESTGRDLAAGTGHVLVVDDELPVRAVLGRFLERLGYSPQLMDPEEAREALRSNGAIDLLITDLSMPGLTGFELGQIAREARPELPMILVTGLADSATIREAAEIGFGQVLAKPFEMAELSETVALVMGRQAAAG